MCVCVCVCVCVCTHTHIHIYIIYIYIYKICYIGIASCDYGDFGLHFALDKPENQESSLPNCGVIQSKSKGLRTEGPVV